MKPVDQKLRDKALNPKQSFIVQAPAGSGKTSLLVARFLSLLAKARRPEEILAITFTRKAAGEMCTRVCQALNEVSSSLGQKVLRQDAKYNWNLLQNPNRLQIYTIDGFCSYIVNQMPILASLGGRASIVQGQDLEFCYREAARNLLLDGQSDSIIQKALAKLLLHLDNDWQRAEKLLAAMLAKREQWLPHIVAEHNCQKLRQVLEQSLQNIIQEHLQACVESLPQQLVVELFAIVDFALEDLAHDEIAWWLSIAQLLLTKTGKLRKNVKLPENNKSMKKRMVKLLSQLAQHPKFVNNLANLLHIPCATYTQLQWDILENLIILLKTLAGYLKVIFKQKNVLDFTEIALSADFALGSLTDPTDLALKLDYKFAHILVDEFQDTSMVQYRILEKLTTGWQAGDGRTLFLVGDPMQSIYKFREAKVGMFLKVQQYGINDLPLTPLTLTSNFRSYPELVHWTNRVFTRVFPKENHIGQGAIAFAASEAQMKQGSAGSVNFHAFAKDDLQGQAAKVVAIISANKKQNPEGKIAVLVRYRSHLTQIIAKLREAKLAFYAPELENLADSVVIQDLFSLTRALLNFEDRIAWFALLRAPWCGLTLSDLHALSGKTKTLWHAIKSFKSNDALSQDGQKRLSYLLPILEQALRQLGRMKIRELIETTWLALNGPDCVSDQNELINAKMYFELLADCSIDIGEGNYDQLRLLAAKLADLYALMTGPVDDLLQIMTIHKAKGLEFDTVIIPGVHHRPRYDEHKLFMWLERPSAYNKLESDLVFAPITATGEAHDKIYQYLRHEDQNKDSFEIVRLLYVAVTRAKSHLHLLACMPQKPVANSFLAYLWPEFTSQPVIANVAQLAIQQIKQPKLTRLIFPNDYKPCQELFPAAKPAQQIHNPFISLANVTQRKLGEVIHKLLFQLSLQNITNAYQSPIMQQSYWKKLLIEVGLCGDMDTNLATINEALHNTLNDPKGRWILDRNHLEAQSEYPLTAIINNKTQYLIIDRTFVENGTRWIIDYKTSKREPQQSLAAFLKQEKKAYHAQLDKYRWAFSALTALPIKAMLYFPLCKAWVEVY